MIEEMQISTQKRIEENQAAIQKKIEKQLAVMVWLRNQSRCSSRKLRNDRLQ